MFRRRAISWSNISGCEVWEAIKVWGFLTDERDGWGFVLTLMKSKKKSQNYPGNFHIGFFIEDKETVDKINRRLKADGFDVPAPENSGHAYGFYIKAPGGFTVEVGA